MTELAGNPPTPGLKPFSEKMGSEIVKHVIIPPISEEQRQELRVEVGSDSYVGQKPFRAIHYPSDSHSNGIVMGGDGQIYLPFRSSEAPGRRRIKHSGHDRDHLGSTGR